MTAEYLTVHANVYSPVSTIFKTKATDRAECQTISCCNPGCPLLAKCQCYMNSGLFSNACPYGTRSRELGPTKRSASCSAWVAAKKKLHSGVPFLEGPPLKMAFIGDYVLLPYYHMNMCEKVPFVKHSVGFSSGSPFILRSDWTLDVVLQIISFRPQAIFGGEIKDFQKETIPKFLVHLQELDPEMWEKLITVRPELNKKPNHIGRKAVLATLKPGIEWVESADKYPVKWHWDGTTLRTTSMHSYSATWGNVKVESVDIVAMPAKGATVVVQSNEWVLESTVFAD